MFKAIAAGLILMSLTGCDILLESFLESNRNDDLCDTNRIPETPDGATAAQVEAEIIEMCRDRENDR